MIGVVSKQKNSKAILILLEDRLKKIKALVKNPKNGGKPAKLKIKTNKEVTTLI